MSEVRVWTIKEGRDSQWVSKGAWIGRGKSIDVVALSDYQALKDILKDVDTMMNNLMAKGNMDWGKTFNIDFAHMNKTLIAVSDALKGKESKDETPVSEK